MRNVPLQIISQEKVVFDDQVNAVTVLTADGLISVLPQHMPLVGLVLSGELIVKKGKETAALAVTGGFLQVRPEKITILADSAERFEELDEKKALEAKEKAEKLLEEKLSEREMAETEASLQKALLQLKLIRKRKGRPKLTVEQD